MHAPLNFILLVHTQPFRGCLHVRFCVQIAILFCVQFAGQGCLELNLYQDFSEMCRQAVVFGV
jgi:hypothetical protein